jgi:16S rRNA (guanine527-N7)-methyltransferase
MSLHPSTSLNAAKVGQALGEYGIASTPAQAEQILSYLKLLSRWNEKVNLTAIRDPVEILHRHFCECMFAGVSVPIERGRLADVGSGAGFPGLPLKILRPDLQVLLIESNMKKAAFLAEVIRELAIGDARVIVGRYEHLREEVASVDFVCSRAVGEFEGFLRWAASDSLAARQVILWAGGRDLDKIRANAAWTWRVPIQIPHSLRRFLVVGDRNLEAPAF